LIQAVVIAVSTAQALRRAGFVSEGTA
jgi:hypothetical protein